MQRRIILLVLLFSLLAVLFGCAQKEDFPVLSGSYLGQKPPGMTPELFAPGIISTDMLEADAAFAQKAEILLFNRIFPDKPYEIFLTEVKNGRWTKPVPAPFNSDNNDWDFKFAPDDRTLYFTSVRPIESGGKPLKNANIWSTEITASGWSEPKMLDFPVNTEEHEAYPSVTIDGTLYFFSIRSDTFGDADLYRSRLVDGKYLKVENLGSQINTGHTEADAFIAPDESYIIFCSDRPGGSGMYDLYISFRQRDGNWTEPENLGEDINTEISETCPSVTIDNKYLFFTVGKEGYANIYWVDAKIIEDLKLKKLR